MSWRLWCKESCMIDLPSAEGSGNINKTWQLVWGNPQAGLRCQAQCTSEGVLPDIELAWGRQGGVGEIQGEVAKLWDKWKHQNINRCEWHVRYREINGDTIPVLSLFVILGSNLVISGSQTPNSSPSYIASSDVWGCHDLQHDQDRTRDEGKGREARTVWGEGCKAGPALGMASGVQKTRWEICCNTWWFWS